MANFTPVFLQVSQMPFIKPGSPQFAFLSGIGSNSQIGESSTERSLCCIFRFLWRSTNPEEQNLFQAKATFTVVKGTALHAKHKSFKLLEIFIFIHKLICTPNIVLTESAKMRFPTKRDSAA